MAGKPAEHLAHVKPRPWLAEIHDVSYDFYGAPAPSTAAPLPVPSRGGRQRRRRHLAIAATALVFLVTAIVVVSQHHAGAQNNLRPLTAPPMMGTDPLLQDAFQTSFVAEMVAPLHGIFGDRGSVSAAYGSLQRGQEHLTFLVAGRGPVDHETAGDVHNTSGPREKFGNVTCALRRYSTDDVCWYSTSTLGVSLLFLDQATRATHVQDLTTMVRQLRAEG